MPTVEGRWADLMFSQRNNPYCDLLKIHCKYSDLYSSTKIFKPKSKEIYYY